MQLCQFIRTVIKGFEPSVAMIKAHRVKILTRKGKKRRGFCENKGNKNKGVDQTVETANNDENKDVNIDNFVNNHDLYSDSFVNNDVKIVIE